MRLRTVLYEGKALVVAALDDDTLLGLKQAAHLARHDGLAFADMCTLAEQGD